MDFVEYQDVLPALKDLGVEEVEDGDGLSRLELGPSKNLKIIHVKAPESRVDPYPEAEVSERSKDEIAELVRELLNRLHLAELLVVPVSTWRDVITCVAYDLAEDEEWQEMDAVSAIHQNTRNPLAITQPEYNVLNDMIASLFRNGESPKHDVIITSDMAPLLIEIFHDGAISITSDPSVSTHIDKALG